MVLADIESRPHDVSSDVMRSLDRPISNDDISGTGRPIDFLFDSGWLLLAASEPRRLPACLSVCLSVCDAVGH